MSETAALSIRSRDTLPPQPLSPTERADLCFYVERGLLDVQSPEETEGWYRRRQIEWAMTDAIERLERSNEAALNQALAAAQGEFEPVTRDRTAQIRTRDGSSYSYNYADLASILAAVRPALAKHGLSITQLLGHNGGPGPTLRTELRHADGGAIVSELQLSGVEGGPQALGSLLTYMRRYAITAILGIATEDDDDGTQAQHGSGAADVNGKPDAAPEMITKDQADKIAELLAELEKQQPANEGATWKELFCAEFNIRSRDELTKRRAGAAIGWLKRQQEAAKWAAA